MLGIGWINQNRVILDYRRKQATIAPTPEQVQAIGSELRKAGYVAIPMTFDEHYHHYVVRATINGVTRSMTVGTASPFLVDTAFADAAGVKRGPGEGEGGGPTGTKVGTYPLSAPVRVIVAGWTSPEISVGIILDLYGYGARQRPADPADATDGYLGGDSYRRRMLSSTSRLTLSSFGVNRWRIHTTVGFVLAETTSPHRMLYRHERYDGKQHK